MLPSDFRLSALLGVAEDALVLHRRVRLTRPPPPAPSGLLVVTHAHMERDPRASMFVLPERFALPSVDADRVARPAVPKAHKVPLTLPDGLDVQLGGRGLSIALEQLTWSAGTPPVLTRAGRARVGLRGRCVLRLRGRRRRWVLDVHGDRAFLYDDRSPAPVPYLGRPSVEDWTFGTPVPGWLSERLLAIANDDDVLAPVIAVGTVLLNAQHLAAANVDEAVRWLRDATEGVEVRELVNACRSRADAADPARDALTAALRHLSRA